MISKNKRNVKYSWLILIDFSKILYFSLKLAKTFN